jgi:hypothetical protein
MARRSLEERHARQMMQFQTEMLKQAVTVLESLPDFAKDPDEDAWQILSGIEREIYSGADLDKMRTQARRIQYTPYGMCVLQTLEHFIIGKSAYLASSDEEPEDANGKQLTVQQYWDQWAKINDWDVRSKETIRRLYRDGEVFWRWFDPQTDDQGPILRFLDPNEVRPGSGGKPTYGIATDPEDIETVLSYHRVWKDSDGVAHENDIDADWIDHHKILVDRDVKRGISYFVPLAKKITEYDKWINDRIILNKIRHLFNVVAEPLNPTASLSNITSQFADEERPTPAGGTKKKKVWKPGTVLASKGVKWDLKSLNINAADTADDGRAIQLVLAIATGFPEYIIRGDASNANYSSSMVAESPFVRMIQAQQDHIAKLYEKAFKRVTDYGIRTGRIAQRYTRQSVSFNRTTGKDETHTETAEITGDCEVQFDSVIARNLKDETESVQIHVAEGWCSKRTASAKFGYDFEKEQDQIARETAEAVAEQQRLGMDPLHQQANERNNDGE